MDLPALVRRAAALAGTGRPPVLGITGSPGAGKTTLAEALVEALTAAPPDGCSPDFVAHVPMDGFHLADVELARLGRSDRKGAPDTFDAGGYAALLARLRHRTDAGGLRTRLRPDRRAADRRQHPGAPRDAAWSSRRATTCCSSKGDWAGVRPHIDEVWVADLDDDERTSRLVARHTRFGKEPEHAVRWVADVDEQQRPAHPHDARSC